MGQGEVSQKVGAYTSGMTSTRLAALLALSLLSNAGAGKLPYSFPLEESLEAPSPARGEGSTASALHVQNSVYFRIQVPLRVGGKAELGLQVKSISKEEPSQGFEGIRHFAVYQLEVRHGRRVQILELPTLNEGFIPGNLILDDFNADGYLDLMIPQNQGYGGVNFFDQLYVYVPRQGRFVPLNKADKTDALFCNPQLIRATHTIQTDCKSGPAYYSNEYRVRGNKVMLIASGLPAVLSGFDGPEEVYLFLVRRGSAPAILSSDSHRVVPVFRSLPVTRAYLHTAPRQDAKTARYIVAGDRVQVLNAGLGGWVQVIYISSKAGRLKAWIQLPGVEIVQP